MPSLLDLPAELRLKIYHYVFCDRDFAVHRGNCCGYQNVYKNSPTDSSALRTITDVPSILLTCHTMSSEVRQMYLENANLLFEDCECWQYIRPRRPDIPSSLMASVLVAKSLTLKTKPTDSHHILRTIKGHYEFKSLNLNQIEVIFDTSLAINLQSTSPVR